MNSTDEKGETRPVLPETRHETYARICADVVRRLQDELGTDLLAVLLSGSVYDGSDCVGSDIDLCVLWDRTYSQRRRIVVEEIEVDLFCDSPDAVRRVIGRARQRFAVSMYAHAVALHDPAGIGAVLMKDAGAVWQRGRSSPPHDMQFQQHCEVLDGLQTIERVPDDDPLGFAYLVGPYVASLVEIAWWRRGFWGTHRKQALRYVRDTDPAMYSDIATVHDPTQPISVRKLALRRLADTALGIDDIRGRDIEGRPYLR